jgi:ArsR family transcriptional regulator, arsenate/arsenite/antimonite-responsive transcriptional repressor
VDHKELATICKALGDPTRTRIFQFLLDCCCAVAVGEEGEVRPVDGPTVGEVCCQVTGADKITSTVSFHLKELRESGLITMEKRGKHMMCSINRETLARLAGYFDNASRESSECC